MTPIRAVLAALALLTAAIGAAGPAAADPAPATMAQPAKGFRLLSAEEFDPGRILPPPPTEGGERQKAELAEVRRAYGLDDRERKDLAQWDNDHEDPSLFAPTLGFKFDMTSLPATAALLELVQNEASTASSLAKKHFKRTRPWAEDKTLVPCDAAEGGSPLTSYPSGHAAIGYSLAGVLATLIPEKAPAIWERASDYAYSREICGDHYPSDTEASHVLATRVDLRLLADPRLAAQLEAARAELKAAGLAAK
jgi:acid phosphatase (class A)